MLLLNHISFVKHKLYLDATVVNRTMILIPFVK